MVNEGCSDEVRIARKEVKKDRFRKERERGGEGGNKVSLR